MMMQHESVAPLLALFLKKHRIRTNHYNNNWPMHQSDLDAFYVTKRLRAGLASFKNSLDIHLGRIRILNFHA